MSFNPNSDQDWTPVTISKTHKQKVAGLSTAQVNIYKPYYIF